MNPVQAAGPFQNEMRCKNRMEPFVFSAVVIAVFFLVARAQARGE